MRDYQAGYLSAMCVFEEVLEWAVNSALELRASDREYDQGQVFAFFQVIEHAKQAAALVQLPPFGNRQLNEIDPYSLLAGHDETPTNK